MARFIYSSEMNNFIKQQIEAGFISPEICKAFEQKFKRSITESQLKSWRKNNKIRVVNRYVKNKGVFMFSDEIVKFIIEHKEEYEAPILAKLINEKYNTDYTARQIKQFKANHGIKTNLKGNFNANRPNPHKGQKGWQVANSKATQFQSKNGNTDEYAPLLTVRKRPGAGGYLFIKIAQPNTWIFYHTYVWEQANGPLKKGEKIKFLNGNPEDCTLENMMIINNRIQGKLYGGKKVNRVSSNPELTKAAILQSKIEIKLQDMKGTK